MLKIWLDDERDPADPEIQRDFGANGDEVWVKTAADAINMLSNGNVASVSFDHDLGKMGAGTGYDVAKYVEQNAFLGKIPKFKWTVHSMNIVGRKNIINCMLKAESFWSNQCQTNS